MYPLKFEKVFKPKVWGGRNLESHFDFLLPPGEAIGESWEVSAHPNGPSRVALGPWKGRLLTEILAEEREKLVGKENWTRFQGRFPLLIKYLDINDKLSVQVHPDDQYALEKEGEFGKSECWYILSASPDASIILGLKEGTTQEEFQKKTQAKEFNGLFREVKVQTGDFIHIVPGTVHASLTGSVLICEIQQNSDTTYRIYDFDRLENGKARPLHLEKALEVIRFETLPLHTSQPQRNKQSIEQGNLEELVRDPYFNVDKLQISGIYHDLTTHSFTIYSFIEGQGTISQGSVAWPVKSGETWLIPAGLQVAVQGRLEFLRSWIGER